MDSYDENLAVNPFFVSLQEQGKDLYDTITTNRWTICVPRIGTVEDSLFNEKDFLNHVLIHDTGHVHNTLSNKVVTVQGSCISTGAGFEESRAVLILFEETYFNDKDESYQVLCINQPLEGGPRPMVTLSDLSPNQLVHSIQDCANLLWAGEENTRIQRGLDDLVNLFNRTCTHMEAESLRHLVDAGNALFTRAMQTVLKDNRLRKNVKTKPNFMDHIKLAVETYTMHGVYRKLFKHVTTSTASHDSRLNKITRNLSDLQLRDLGVRQEFCYNVPWARRELANLKRYSTPLGKLNCIRRVVQRLQQPPRNSKPDEPSIPLTTDDLLPILVFLVVKAEMPNWWAHFYYMTCFRFAKASNDDEYGFYLATLEAALEHVRTGQLNTLELGAENPQRVQLSLSTEGGSIWQRQDSSDSQTNALFQYIRSGDREAVEKVLERRPARTAVSDIQSELCHPLCACPRCTARVAELETDNTPTIFSRDDRGYTVLHIAAQQGGPEMADYLLKQGAIVNATDYHGHSPLHISCQRGQQAVTLLLLHYNTDMNLQDNDGNSPLHLACANGHEECVKALVYYDHHNTQLDVNPVNDFGDTPLHLAAKWGYESIVEILWENGASVKTKNRKKQTPLDCAHNIKVARILVKASDDRDRLIRRRSSDSSLKMTRSASLHVMPSAAVRDMLVPPPGAASRRTSVNGLTRSATLPTVQQGSSTTPSDYSRKVDKLLKAVADGDLQMVCFHLGWTDDVMCDVDDVDVTQQTLCHPLCQCDKCSPIQQLTTSVTGMYVNCTNQEGMTPLHVACVHAHPPLVQLFCKRGANVNMKTTTYEQAPLHCACQNNRKYTKEVVEILIEFSAKVNQVDGRGNTPLHVCCLTGNRLAANILVKAGADVNVPNQKGNTPLHEAARWNSLPLTQLLLLEGASVNIRNRKQQTSLHLAQNDKVLRLLLEASTSQSQSSRSSDSGSTTEEPMSPPAAVSTGLPGGQNLQRGPEAVETPRKVAIRELFAALAEKDIETLQNLSQDIQRFDRRRSLRQTTTRDRSAPRLDRQLACQLSIQHFDTSTLRRTSTTEHRHPIVLDDDTNCSSAEVMYSFTEATCGSTRVNSDSTQAISGKANQTSAEDLVSSSQIKADADDDVFSEEPSGLSDNGVPPPGPAASGFSIAPHIDGESNDGSVSSEDSDIFVREREYVKFVPVEPQCIELQPAVATDKSACSPSKDKRTKESDLSITNLNERDLALDSSSKGTKVILKSPGHLGNVLTAEVDCGSDAEADVFFHNTAHPEVSIGVAYPGTRPDGHSEETQGHVSADKLKANCLIDDSSRDITTPPASAGAPGLVSGETDGDNQITSTPDTSINLLEEHEARLDTRQKEEADEVGEG